MGSTNNKMSYTFVNRLATPVEFGQVFVISGKTTRTARRFNVNLQCDRDSRDIALHLSFRLDENTFIRNSKANNNYGTEERGPAVNNARLPFRAGTDFTVYILCGHDRFYISLNDVFFNEFVYRLPLNRITYLRANEDIDLITQADHRKIFPVTFPAIQTRQSWFSFSNDTSVQIRTGNAVILTGNTFGSNKGSFTLRFMVSHTEKTALHFNVRFGQNVVIRNNNVNDRHEFNPRDEERHGGFPFIFGRSFKIAIGYSDRNFRIAVNGAFFCEYPYKANIYAISGIKASENDGTILNITEIDNVNLDSNLRNLENLSRI